MIRPAFRCASDSRARLSCAGIAGRGAGAAPMGARARSRVRHGPDGQGDAGVCHNGWRRSLVAHAGNRARNWALYPPRLRRGRRLARGRGSAIGRSRDRGGCVLLHRDPCAHFPRGPPRAHTRWAFRLHGAGCGEGKSRVGADLRVHHARDDITRWARESRFRIQHEARVSARRDRGEPVPGALYVLSPDG